MPTTRMNIRDFCARYSHLDGGIADVRSKGTDVTEVVIRFYPWFEHPAYIAAVKQGKPWRFHDLSAARREVRIFVRGSREALLAEGGLATEVEFFEDHPRLWPHEPSQELFINGAVDLGEVLLRLDQKLGGHSRQDLYRWIDPLAPLRRAAPFALSPVPLSLAGPLQEVLGEAGVPFVLKASKPFRERPCLLEFDHSYFIAEDFEVDLPEFEHRPEWFAS